jgi:anti-sigma factor RsiW
MSCAYLDRDLDAYVDRELAADADAAVRAHLDGCVRCTTRVAERNALTRLVRAAPYYEAPPALRARVVVRSWRTRSIRRVIVAAAAAAVIVAATVPLRLALRGERTEIDDVVDGHVRALMADHLFDVRSTDQHTVKPWFTGRLDFSPAVMDLASIGYPLIGGRVDYLRGRPVAALVYQRRQHVVNVFVAPDDGSPEALRAQSRRGFNVRHWIAAGMSYWAVSDLNDVELSEFARALGAS